MSHTFCSLLLLLAALFASAAHAEFQEFQYWDQFGLPPPQASDPEYQIITEFLNRTKPGGELKVSTHNPIELVSGMGYLHGIPVQRAPFAEPYVYEYLAMTDPRGISRTLFPLLAERIFVDMEGQRLRVILREASFSDGSKVTAQAVKESWDYYRKESFGDADATLLKRIWGEELDISIRGEREFEMHFAVEKSSFRDAVYYFLGIPVMKVASVEHPPGFEVAEKDIGSGPYVVEHVTRNEIRLVRRKDYWGNELPLNHGRYNVDAIRVSVIRDTTVERLAFLRGDLNFFRERDWPYEEWMQQQINDKDKVRIVQTLEDRSTDAQSTVIAMNMDKPDTGRLAFRKALALAYDGDAENKILPGKMRILSAPGSLSPLSPKGEPSPVVRELLQLTPDPLAADAGQAYEKIGFEWLASVKGLRARLLLAAKILRDDGYSVKEDGKLYRGDRQVVIRLIQTYDATSNPRMHIFASALQRLGIDLEFHMLADRATYLAERRVGRYDLAAMNIVIAPRFEVVNLNYLRQQFKSEYAIPTSGNIANLRSPLLDKLIERMTEVQAGTQAYADAAEAMLRVLSAELPFIMFGDYDTSPVYLDRGMCVLPVDTETLETLSFGCDSGK